MAGPVLVCFAVPEEAKPFRQHPPPHTDLLLTGIGPLAARRSIQHHSTTHPAPRLLLTCGFAGGLHPDWPTGTLAFDSADAPALHPILQSLGARPARFLHSDRVLLTPAEKSDARRRTGCDAVEMESQALRDWAREHAIPAATLRVISDAASDELPLDFNRVIAPDGSLRLVPLGGALLRRPHRIPSLIALGRTTAAAATRLADTLRALLNHPNLLPGS